MTYTNAEHLRDWDDLRQLGPGEDEQHYCGDCGEPIAAPGAACLNCAESIGYDSDDDGVSGWHNDRDHTEPYEP